MQQVNEDSLWEVRTLIESAFVLVREIDGRWGESLAWLCRWSRFGKGERMEREGDETVVYRLLFSTSGVGMWLGG